MSDAPEYDELDPVEPPTPDDVALAAMHGLLAAGPDVDVRAAVALAWMQAVPAFFEMRDKFSEFMEKLHNREG